MTTNYTINSGITAALTRMEGTRDFIQSAPLPQEWLEKMRDLALIREAHHSTHIEGTRLTREQSEKLLQGGKVPEADPHDKRELLNYREAFHFVLEVLQGELPLSEKIIKKIHKKLVEGVRGGAAGPGKYRKIQNYVVNTATRQIIYAPPSAKDVPALMTELAEWLNSETGIHPILKSGIAQFQLVHIHPFLDGNGRVSRLLSLLCLYRAGYDLGRIFPLSEYYDHDRPGFYRAIQSVRERGMDMTGWIEYYCAGLEAQLGVVKTRGEREVNRGD